MKRGLAKSVRLDSDLVAVPAAGAGAANVVMVAAEAEAAAIAIATDSLSQKCDLDEEAGEPAFLFFSDWSRAIAAAAV